MSMHDPGLGRDPAAGGPAIAADRPILPAVTRQCELPGCSMPVHAALAAPTPAGPRRVGACFCREPEMRETARLLGLQNGILP